jgi:hypothetical protein
MVVRPTQLLHPLIIISSVHTRRPHTHPYSILSPGSESSQCFYSWVFAISLDFKHLAKGFLLFVSPRYFDFPGGAILGKKHPGVSQGSFSKTKEMCHLKNLGYRGGGGGVTRDLPGVNGTKIV